MPKRYTVGFLFNADLSKVLLIHKLTPEWQRGKVNGLGGKYEEGEDANRCIARETREEAAVDVPAAEWRRVGSLFGAEWHVDVMAARHAGAESDARSLEEQQVEWFAVGALPQNAMSNLHWLVPLCLNALRTDDIVSADVRYRDA
jgi:8-oxo-dGTP diphosphatase